MHRDRVTANAEAFVKKQLSGEGTGHDWWHIERVRSTARRIHKFEGGSWFIIDMALLLHDVGDYKVIGKKEDDYTIAENFLTSQNVPADIIKRVMFIIKNMSYSKSIGSKMTTQPIEFSIVQDADRLDAIGAIGIARAFAYGGSKGKQLYDPTLKAQEYETTEAYRATTGSTYHHFEEKLLRIKDMLNTSTARAIANKRDQYMREFLAQFLGEWNGAK